MQLSSILIVTCAVLFLAVGAFAQEEESTLTPFGYRPKSCVHAVGEEDLVVLDEETNKLRVLYKDGSVREFEECPAPIKRRENQVGATPNGWAAYTLYLTNTAMTYFGGIWTVPPVPQQAGTQTLFLFTGFQNAYGAENVGVSIIQPVLQWGVSDAGGGPYWAIASWFVGAGHAVYSPLVKVAVGDTIVGNMTLNSVTNQWALVTNDTTIGQASSINVKTGVDEIDAFVTLEVYGVATCGDYPNGNTTFYDLYLQAGTKSLTPQWKTQVEPGCQEAVTIVSPQVVTVKF